MLFNVPINAAVSQAVVGILCVYDERPTRCKSRDTCPDIIMWLKNGVSSHSYIGHW